MLLYWAAIINTRVSSVLLRHVTVGECQDVSLFSLKCSCPLCVGVCCPCLHKKGIWNVHSSVRRLLHWSQRGFLPHTENTTQIYPFTPILLCLKLSIQHLSFWPSCTHPSFQPLNMILQRCFMFKSNKSINPSFILFFIFPIQHSPLPLLPPLPANFKEAMFLKEGWSRAPGGC